MTPLSYHLRSLVVRAPTSAAAALGVALVVFVAAAVLMLLSGLRFALGAGGDPRRVVVLREGSEAELTSQFEMGAVGRVLAGPGVELGEAEVVVTMGFERADGGIANAVLRGVGERSAELREGVGLVRGRWPVGPGELAVGRALIGRYPGLREGAPVALGDDDAATIVGVFAADGAASESELWAERGFVQSIAGRRDLASSVLLRVSDVEGFEAWVASDAEAGLTAMKESELKDRQGDRLAGFLLGVGMMLGTCFALAAALGVAVTMHASVARRMRELGTLRALGFTRGAVLLGVLVEGAAVALAGGGMGIGGAALLARQSFSLVNPSNFSQLVFELRLDGQVVAASLGIALVAGLAGALLPAVRAATIPPAGAMRRG